MAAICHLSMLVVLPCALLVSLSDHVAEFVTGKEIHLQVCNTWQSQKAIYHQKYIHNGLHKSIVNNTKSIGE